MTYSWVFGVVLFLNTLQYCSPLSEDIDVNFHFDNMIGDYCCCGDNIFVTTSLKSVFITVDSVGATSPGPSVYLAGDYDEDSRAELSLSEESAISVDLGTAAGNYSLVVFTDPSAPYTSGIWFIAPEGNETSPSLILPDLPESWRYEAWVQENSEDPISIGVFQTGLGVDSDGAGVFAGNDVSSIPNAPGQEFVTTERNLGQNHSTFVTVEPFPDNDPSTPFGITALFTSVSDIGPYPEIGELFNFAFSNPHGASQLRILNDLSVQVDVEVVGFELLNVGYAYHIWGVTDDDQVVLVGTFNEEGNALLTYEVEIPDLN